MTEPTSHEAALREAITGLEAIRARWRSQSGGRDPDGLQDVSRAIDRLASAMDQEEVLREARRLGGLEAAEGDLEGLPEDLR